MDTGASLYDCMVYSCLANRVVLDFEALLTSGGWGDNDEVCGNFGVMGCTPRAWVPDHYQRWIRNGYDRENETSFDQDNWAGDLQRSHSCSAFRMQG